MWKNPTAQAAPPYLAAFDLSPCPDICPAQQPSFPFWSNQVSYPKLNYKLLVIS
jgi:hypothetical protein